MQTSTDKISMSRESLSKKYTAESSPLTSSNPEFRLTKAFGTWKNGVRRQKFAKAAKSIQENSSIYGNNHMRNCFGKLYANLAKLSAMGVTDIQSKTKHVNDFFTNQSTQVERFAENLILFRDLARKLVLEAAKATFAERGFNYDDYESEHATMTILRGNKSPSAAASILSANHLQPLKKLTFIEQANKRQSCVKIISFIRLVDIAMKEALHRIVYNSMVAIQKALEARSKTDPTTGESDHSTAERDSSSRNGNWSGDQHRMRSSPRTSNKMISTAGGGAAAGDDAEQEVVPVFFLTIGVSQEKSVTYTPDISVFNSTFSSYLSRLNEILASVPSLLQDKVFCPFTQPMLYGKLESYNPKAEDETVFFSGHHERCQDLLAALKRTLSEAFVMCEIEMTPYTKTAFEFCQPQHFPSSSGGSDKTNVETDVEVLKATLSSLQQQQAAIKSVRDSKAVSFFKVDLRLFKRTVLPNISRAITKLQESLPKVGREKMEDFGEDAKALKDKIEFEPKSTEDYVVNMDVVDKMNESFDALEYKLLAIENVYSIMNEIPIPISADDKSSLKGLKALMNSLAQKIQERIKVQAEVLPHFRKKLETEERILRETIQNALKDVKNPTLLEAEASIEEIKPTLNKMESVLVQSRERVLRYNEYEKTYGFAFSEYFELIAAEQTLAALKMLWKCVEAWDKIYDEWSTVNFELLDVHECQEKTDKIKMQIMQSQEVLGENPVSSDLGEKVNTMLSNLPCLMDLKAKSLKERHWKMISDVVGSDLKAHKVTLGFLEQNNVFNFAHNVVRIVRTAEMEEQLDGLVENLRKSWTEKKLSMVSRHGMPTVQDFKEVYDTVTGSLQTLKQLGSSQYSKEMRDQLIDWYKTVCDAKEAIDVIKTAQTSWITQDAPLTSMPFEDENPLVFQLFQERLYLQC